MKVAVFFPGIGYHCDKPLLYYSRAIAGELNYDEIIKLSYSFEGSNIRGNIEKMQEAFETLYAQAEESLKDIAFDEYDEILFVSKSVGTIIASAYASKHKINCSHVLYTPLEYTFDYPHDKACAFIGTADAWSKVPDVIKKAEENNVPIFVYDGLNHSLEGSNSAKNIDVLSDVMNKTYSFINDEEK